MTISRPKLAAVIVRGQSLVVQASSQHDPYPSFGPTWVSEPVPSDISPEELGQLVQDALRRSNNEPWTRPVGQPADPRETLASRALGARTERVLVRDGARHVSILVHQGRMVLRPSENDHRGGGFSGIGGAERELPEDPDAETLGREILAALADCR